MMGGQLLEALIQGIQHQQQEILFSTEDTKYGHGTLERT